MHAHTEPRIYCVAPAYRQWERRPAINNIYIMQAMSTNGLACVLLTAMLINDRKKHSGSNKEYVTFKLMLVSNLCQCIMETLTIVLDGAQFPGARVLAMIANTFLFLNNICLVGLWAFYADMKVRHEKPLKRKAVIIKFFLLAISLIFVIINIFTPVYFEITEQNQYVRAFLFPFSGLVTYLYLALGTFDIYRHRVRMHSKAIMPVLTFLMPVVIATVIQFIFTGISLLWAGVAVGLASAYMSLLDESSSIDVISGLFSRHHLNYYLTLLPEKPTPSKNIYGIMIDGDKFKQINDEHGHLIGDDAIASIGRVLSKAVDKNDMIFRYGGDEFVIIGILGEDRTVEDIVDRINLQAEWFNKTERKPYKLKFSMGYTMYIPGEKGREFVARMDNEMYKNKKLREANRGAN